MIRIVTVEQLRAIEREGDASGVSYATMMDNAGRALATRVLDRLAGEPARRIVVLVGSGNNGGDALVAGRLIAQESPHTVHFYLTKPRGADDPNFAAAETAGLPIHTAKHDPAFENLSSLIASADVILDGILGIGLSLPIRGGLASIMQATNSAIQAAREQVAPAGLYTTPDAPSPRPAKRPYVIAVDCPSGLDCDTGALDDLAIPADETVTFAAAKVGQVLFPGAGACGTLHVASIGLPEGLSSLDTVALSMPSGADIAALLPPTPADAHKGTFGKVLNVTGSLNYTGAAALAAEAAYRLGAGLVTVAAPQIITPVLATQVPEATWLLLPHDMGAIAEPAASLILEEMPAYNAMLLGPGWGREEATRHFLTRLLAREQEEARHERIGFAPSVAWQAQAPAATDLPSLVIDADGLNLLSEIDAWWEHLPPGTVLTPHPGEMARLTGLSRDEVNAGRLALAAEKAAEWDCIVLLKGAFSVVAAPDGRIAVLPFAEPALSTAGTGDILAGAIVSLLAQGCAPFEAALAAGYIHGLAGRLARQAARTPRSVIARDVLNHLQAALSQLEAGA
ncbi:MAG: NAD(P)H-hydrate dehydratase [Anaerolineae bacterium]|nr:NAD(P)H-hydrate dehydratase [Anaerolineae bacterium]